MSHLGVVVCVCVCVCVCVRERESVCVGGGRQRESVTVFLVHITSSVCVYIYYMCLPCICVYYTCLYMCILMHQARERYFCACLKYILYTQKQQRKIRQLFIFQKLCVYATMNHLLSYLNHKLSGFFADVELMFV